MTRFNRGQSILKRGLDEHGRIIGVKPVTVAEDSEELVALWLPLGVPTKLSRLIDHVPGTPRVWMDGNWELVDSTWRWAELLILVRPGELRANWVRWSANREFLGWAVNLQSELTMTPLGFDVVDYQLDIMVNPDRSWQWKDEDEFQIAIEMGRITSEIAGRVRKEAERAVEDIEAGVSPFTPEWRDWTPDELKPPERLTPSWTDLSMYESF